MSEQTNEVINISAKLFELITREACTPQAIARHGQLLLSRVKDADGRKICVVDERGADHWFDHTMQPTQPAVRKYPSLARQAMNVSASAVKAFNEFGTDSSDPRLLVSTEERQRRLDICGTCELFDAGKKKCTKCGCKMPWKVALKSANCPHPDGDRWLVKEVEDE